jgi:hypothetical protein
MVLANDDPDIANIDGALPAVFPVEDEAHVGARFERVFPAHSLTILRLK